jgi:hypothetical protein
MISDSINDEILRIKHELAAVHGNDVRRIAADARARQRNAISLPPRPIMSEQSDAPIPVQQLPTYQPPTENSLQSASPENSPAEKIG